MNREKYLNKPRNPELDAWVDKFSAMSPYDISQFLREEQVIGLRSNTGNCPLANFLRSKINCQVRVSPLAIFSRDYACAGTPESVKEFIRNFDTGRYPALIDYANEGQIEDV